MTLPLNQIIEGDCLEVLKTFPSESVDCCVTSPPYWNLRDYGVDGQLGLEATFQEYIIKLCDIFDEVKRVLKKEGTCFVNIADTYNSTPIGRQVDPKRKSSHGNFSYDHKKTIAKDLPTKCLLQIPSRFAIEMTNRGWILRNEIIWHKPNVMPQNAKDRFTVDFEKIFFFTKSKKYYFEQQYEPARSERQNTDKNKRAVWTILTQSFEGAHFATYPEKLVEPMILAGCPKDGIVLDPFSGACTTQVVAHKLGRKYVGVELNGEYIKICNDRLDSLTKSLF